MFFVFCFFPIIARLQCGNSGIQEHLFHSLGRGRPGQDSASVAALLPEHSGGVGLPNPRRKSVRATETEMLAYTRPASQEKTFTSYLSPFVGLPLLILQEWP